MFTQRFLPLFPRQFAAALTSTNDVQSDIAADLTIGKVTLTSGAK
jgi:hypothetical protein